MRAFAYLSDRTAGWIEKPRPHATGYDAVIRHTARRAEEKVLQEDTEPFEEDFFFDDENTDQNKT